jgi:UDP-N-acetylglucosamine acyltransferase
MTKIHPTAIVSDGANIDFDVEIGPFSIVGPDVNVGAGTQISAHVVVTGNTTIGANCKIYPFTTVGEAPQDIKYSGEPTQLKVGDRTVIREHVTIHRGTTNGEQVTYIGNDCYIMESAHIGHDCIIGNSVILVNQSKVAGHVTIGDHTIVGVNAVIQQFSRVGKHAYLVAPIAVTSDIIPFGIAKGMRETLFLQGLNFIGLKQRGFSRENIKTLREAYLDIFDGPTNCIGKRAQLTQQKFSGNEHVYELTAFILEKPDRTLCLPKQFNQKNNAESV